MRKWFGLAPLALAAACAEGAEIAQRIPADSAAFYRTQVQELTAVAATRDSMTRDLAETTRLLADINSELAKVTSARRPVEPVAAGESPLANTANERAAVLKRVQDLTTRLRSTESRLATSQRRLRQMGDTVSHFQTTVDGLNSMVESQKNTIATLEADLTSTRQQVTVLAEEKAVLTDTVSAVTTRENQVFYVIGTRAELAERGLIKEEGGTRWLIFTRTGEVLKPAENLDPAAFTAVDRRSLSEIPLPDPEAQYRLITNQNIAFSNITPEAKGKVKGALQITSPERFWGQSRFLILVQD